MEGICKAQPEAGAPQAIPDKGPSPVKEKKSAEFRFDCRSRKRVIGKAAAAPKSKRDFHEMFLPVGFRQQPVLALQWKRSFRYRRASVVAHWSNTSDPRRNDTQRHGRS